MRKEDIKPTAVDVVGSGGTGKYILIHDPTTGKTQRIGINSTTDPSVTGAIYFDGTRLRLSTNGF